MKTVGSLSSEAAIQRLGGAETLANLHRGAPECSIGECGEHVPTHKSVPQAKLS